MKKTGQLRTHKRSRRGGETVDDSTKSRNRPFSQGCKSAIVTGGVRKREKRLCQPRGGVEMSVVQELLKQLPFVAHQGEVIRLWCVQHTGVWSADNATGRKYAELFIDFMQKSRAPNHLAHVVRAMAETKKFEGIEIGFLHGIAAAAMNCQLSPEKEFLTETPPPPPPLTHHAYGFRAALNTALGATNVASSGRI